jgi:hypothetical protein
MVAAAARGDKGPHQEALAALAAMRAAAANLRVRCGFCEACLATQGAARRCLVNRAAAAAAAGHSGAQVCTALSLQGRDRTSFDARLLCPLTLA